MRAEHQIDEPPLMSQQVCLCIAFFVRLCIALLDLLPEETQIGDPPLPPPMYMYVSISLKNPLSLHVI